MDFTTLGGMPVGWFLDSEDANAQNVFWNPGGGFGGALQRAYEADKAGEKGPWNIGGGPTLWVGPEFGSYACNRKTRFCRAPGNYDTWNCQPGMGLGGFSMSTSAKNVHFLKTAKLKEYQTGDTDSFEFDRSFHLARPSKEAGKGIRHASALGFADYLTSETAKDFQVWDLVRLPAGTEEDVGTVIFPTSERGMSVYMARGSGERFDDYVHLGDDHASIRVGYSEGSLHKLALPPSCMRLVDDFGLIMYITALPNGNHQLLVAKFYDIPKNDEDILEASSLDIKIQNNLPEEMSYGKGGLFNYMGPSPTEEWEFFTEVEGLGSRPNERIAGTGYESVQRGRLEVYEGGLTTLTGLIREFGAISKPYLFD